MHDATPTIDGCDLSAPAPGHLLPPARVHLARGLRRRDAADLRAQLGARRRPAGAPGGGRLRRGAIGTTPVVVVRGHDGELRGFLNACRAPRRDGRRRAAATAGGSCAARITRGATAPTAGCVGVP